MKSFYNTKSMRERLLMLGFVAIGVLWWGSALVTRVRSNVHLWNNVAQDAQTQRMWQDQAGAIAERTAQAASKLDAARTMSATQAYAEVDRLAQGLPHDMGAPRTDLTDNFAIHSLQITFRRVDMAGLIRFYEGVASRAPYVGIDQCTISADRATPGMVNAVFRVYSVEAIRAAAPQ